VLVDIGGNRTMRINRAVSAIGLGVTLSLGSGIAVKAGQIAITSITDLGTLGGSTSYATGINGLGQVVGYSTNAGGVEQAFVYSGGSMSGLGTLGGSSSYATGIDNAGQIVGYSDTTGGSATRAFLYTPGSGMIDLGTLGGAANSAAYGINNAGQIVGFSYPGPGGTQGFLYAGGDHGERGYAE